MQYAPYIAQNIPFNKNVVAMWLFLTKFEGRLSDAMFDSSGFDWNWFCSFCAELDITSLVSLVNLDITRAEANPLWSTLSPVARQLLCDFFGMTPDRFVNHAMGVIGDLCKTRHRRLTEETQRNVVIELWQQARGAIGTTTWCTPDRAYVLALEMPIPEFKL